MQINNSYSVNRINKLINYSFYFLFLGGLILMSYGNSASSAIQSDQLNSSKQRDSIKKHKDWEVSNKTICAPSRSEVLVNDPNHVYQRPDIFPTYVGGNVALNNFIAKTIMYPKWEKENHIEGRVFVEFIVEKDGGITNPKILKEPKGSRNLVKETLRVLSIMPKWKAGVKSGKKVRVSYVIPVLFSLN